MEHIAHNVAAIQAAIAEAAIRAGRNPKDIALCAATKMNDTAAVKAAIAAGVDCCGENRVQELQQKQPEGAYEGAPIHFIGHLQTNKVKYVVGSVDIIQSVDRLDLLRCIQREAAKKDVVQNILLEVNVGDETSKSGFRLAEVLAIAEKIVEYPNVYLRGIMSIPPISTHSGSNSDFFRKLHQLFVDIEGKKYDNVNMDYLSMGMSDDFPDAIANGSTMVRIGTAIFGVRRYEV